MITFRKATIADMKLYFDWANDEEVRQRSYQSEPIDWTNHQKWFSSKLEDKSCMLLIFQDEEQRNIGQVRIQLKNENEAIIGISVAENQRGKGYARVMIQQASDEFLIKYPKGIIHAYIKQENKGSKRAFELAGFKFKEMLPYLNFTSYHYTMSNL